jgi:hypothetical protein
VRLDLRLTSDFPERGSNCLITARVSLRTKLEQIRETLIAEEDERSRIDGSCNCNPKIRNRFEESRRTLRPPERLPTGVQGLLNSA